MTRGIIRRTRFANEEKLLPGDMRSAVDRTHNYRSHKANNHGEDDEDDDDETENENNCEVESYMGQFLCMCRQKKNNPSEDSVVSRSSESKSTSQQRPLFECCRSPAQIIKVFKFAVEEWVFLGLLGLIMAIFSLTMDILISKLQDGRISIYKHFRDDPVWVVSFVVWTTYAVLLTCASALCAHYIAPQAIGSGIPEMKTILRGMVLKEYLTIRTLISKMIALTLSLGSGLPVGKEGPFVHIASVVANQLSRFLPSSGAFENESRANEMLAAGCAVGVACTFSAPVGGVLFSIEVTAAYFAVRNYWRGFFAATCSATLFSVLQGLRRGSGKKLSDWADLFSVSVAAHYQTTFSLTDSFMSSELIVFAAMGFLCGIFGALFIFLHRTVVLFLRRNKCIKFVLQKYWLLYPAVVSLLISSITFPLGTGKYLGGEQIFSHTLNDFFAVCSWLEDDWRNNLCQPLLRNQTWTGPNNDIDAFHSLVAFQITFFILSIIASTLPIPSGIFMPVFVIGASFGRTIGELIRLWYPTGLVQNVPNSGVHPGIYAVVGAAAFCGAVTHTVSVAVIVFELTGQLVLLIPVMIAVLVANAVCSHLQPSIYDSIIKIKRLPYLPAISHSSSMYHSVSAAQFMTTPVAYVAKDSTYAELQELIYSMSRVQAFPLVENRKSMALLGSVRRSQLFKLLQSKVGVKARQIEATRRIQRALNEVNQRYRMAAEARPSHQSAKEENGIGNNQTLTRFTVQAVESEDSSPSKSSAISQHNLLTVETPLNLCESKSMPVMGLKRNRLAVEDDHHHSFDGYLGDMFRSITRKSLGRAKKARDTEFDLHGEERVEWEKEVLRQRVDLSQIQIDPSPFQLVESTSLFKVHSLFSLLSLKRAYVTKAGQLVGVISLKDLRAVIENLQSGVIPNRGEAMFKNDKPSDDESVDIDYLHPQLEVLTTHNTCVDFNQISSNSTTPTLKDYALTENCQSSEEPPPLGQLSSAISAPCLWKLSSECASDCTISECNHESSVEHDENNTISEGKRESPVEHDECKKSSTTLTSENAEDAANGLETSKSERSVERRRPPHIRIIMPDENPSDTE